MIRWKKPALMAHTVELMERLRVRTPISEIAPTEIHSVEKLVQGGYVRLSPLGLSVELTRRGRRALRRWTDRGEKPRFPQPVIDTAAGTIVALRWPCGHESDPSADRCPMCAATYPGVGGQTATKIR